MKKLTSLFFALCLLTAAQALEAAANSSGITFASSPDGEGILVEKVLPGTPAALAGLAPNDIVLEMDGRPLEGALPPEELQDRIEGKLGAGRSALLTFRRGGWKTAAWITPLRLTAAQKATLDFCQRFRPLHREADSAWREACAAFRETIKGPYERQLFLDEVETWRDRLRVLGRRGAVLPIPTDVGDETFRDLQALTAGMASEQHLRNQTLTFMKDYLENLEVSRREAVFTQMDSPYEVFDRQTVGERRWNRMTEKAEKARRATLRLESLFRKALEENGLGEGDLIDPLL